jgi:hypothetical protein
VCEGGTLPFCISRAGPYRGDLFSTREREIGPAPGLSWWVLRKVVRSRALGMTYCLARLSHALL